MKKFLKCRVTISLVACWIFFSAVGYLQKDTIYKKYAENMGTMPYFVLVLQGIHDNVYPWSTSNGAAVDVHAAQRDDYEKSQVRQESIAKQQADRTSDDAVGSKTPKQAKEKPKAEQADQKKREDTVTKEEPEIKKKEFVQVGDDYFDDAVFIGDSRTVGLGYYGGLDQADFFATKGMNIYDLWQSAFCDLDGSQVTLEEALGAKQYKKVYFQIGINEMGTGTVASFMDSYRQTVEKLKELQPDAILFIQGIMRVTKEKSDRDAIYNNPGIDERNIEIAKLADGERVFYIDVNDVVSDENGALRADLTFDNLHLYATNYGIWVDYLKTKGITEDS